MHGQTGTAGWNALKMCLMIGASLLPTAASLGAAQDVFSLPPPGEPLLCTLTTEEAMAPAYGVTEHRLTIAGDRYARLEPARLDDDQFWVLSPAGSNLYRIQIARGNRLWSLAADQPGQHAVLQRTRSDVHQLWRVYPSLAVAGALRFESVVLPGHYLAGAPGATVTVQPASDSRTQNWFLSDAAPPPQIRIPVVEMAEQVVRPRGALPPVSATFVNSHSSDLWVLLRDLRDGSVRQLRIPARGSVPVELERDAGARIEETYRVLGPGGNIYSERLVTDLPPLVVYDVTVYERFLQSIAIDRTGKSPQRIEDVNYQPKGIGVFPIPAGSAFRGGRVDVYRTARDANNAGAVPHLRPDAEPGQENPLERLLREAAAD